MHGELVKEVEKKVAGISTAEASTGSKVHDLAKASFKGAANTVVRKDDMATIRRSRKSTYSGY
jgi:hypothetical protein